MPDNVNILRDGVDVPLAKTIVLATATTSEAINISKAAFGGITVPATVDGTSIGFSVCATEGGTYVTLRDTANAAIALTITAATATAVALPPELFGFNYFKIVCGSTQTTTDTQFIVSLKA